MLLCPFPYIWGEGRDRKEMGNFLVGQRSEAGMAPALAPIQRMEALAQSPLGQLVDLDTPWPNPWHLALQMGLTVRLDVIAESDPPWLLWYLPAGTKEILVRSDGSRSGLYLAEALCAQALADTFPVPNLEDVKLAAFELLAPALIMRELESLDELLRVQPSLPTAEAEEWFGLHAWPGDELSQLRDDQPASESHSMKAK